MRANIPSAFPLSGQSAQPVDGQIAAGVSVFVLEVTIHAKGEGQEGVAYLIGIGNGVFCAAALHPPEVGGIVVSETVVPCPVLERYMVTAEMIRPIRFGKGFSIGAALQLHHDRVAHGAVVRGVRRGSFSKGSFPIGTHAEVGTGQRREDAVAGAVCELFSMDGVPCLGWHHVAIDRCDAILVTLGIQACAVKQ